MSDRSAPWVAPEIEGGFPVGRLIGLWLSDYSVDSESLSLVTRASEYAKWDDDAAFKFKHYQDCCELVTVDRALISDEPRGKIIDARGWAWSDETPDCLAPGPSERESYTWTRVDIRTEGGGLISVVWLGQSNGYYEEGINFIGPDGWSIDWDVTP
jgi:hypothetical protein